jgi:flagellin-specific chaperone FliS
MNPFKKLTRKNLSSSLVMEGTDRLKKNLDDIYDKIMDVVMTQAHLLNQLTQNQDIITPYPLQILQQQI